MERPLRLITFAESALLIAAMVLFRPRTFGGEVTYAVVAGSSMEPTLQEGDLAVLRSSSNYHVGDVVAFHAEQAYVIHRIVQVGEGGLVVQGDNKPYPDPWHPRNDSILGRLWFKIPSGGRAIDLLRAPITLGGIAGLLGILYVLSPPRKANKPQERIRAGELATKRQFANLLLTIPSLRNPSGREGTSLGGLLGRWRLALTGFRERGRGKSIRTVGISPRLLMRSAARSGKLRLRRELPPGSQIYLIGEGHDLSLVLLNDDTQNG